MNERFAKLVEEERVVEGVGGSSGDECRQYNTTGYRGRNRTSNTNNDDTI